MNVSSVKSPTPDADPTTQAVVKKTTPQDAKKIEESARQFEAMLVRQVLSETFKPAPTAKGQGMPGSDIYQSFMTDTVADNISKSGSLGISHLLQSQLTSAKVSHVSSRKPHV